MFVSKMGREMALNSPSRPLICSYFNEKRTLLHVISICSRNHRVWKSPKKSHFPRVYLNFPGKNGLKITPGETIFAKKKDEKMLEILPKIHIWKILIRYCTVFCLQNGDAPLHIAVALGRKRMAKKLIRLGASGHIRNNVSMLLSRLKSHYLLPSREKKGFTTICWLLGMDTFQWSQSSSYFQM